MPAKKWTAEKAVRRISRLHRSGKKLSSRYARKKYPSLYLAALRYCGGWRQAIEMVGIDYDSVRVKERGGNNRVWTERKVIAAIRSRCTKKLPLNYHAMVTTAGTLLGGAIRCFGSWKKAVEATGIDYDRVRLRNLRKWSKKQIVIEIIARCEAGLSIKGADVWNEDKALYTAAMRHFGKKGWAKARVLAGFDPIDPRPWAIWNAENVVEEILRLNANHVSLNISSLQMSPFSYVIAAGRKVFGSWARAIKESDLDYEKIRLQRPALWTKERIVACIQNLEKSGVRLSTKDIQKRFGGMFRQATERFGCWSKALEAAGIDHRRHYRMWSTKAWLRRMQEDEYIATLERARIHAKKGKGRR